MEWFKAQWQDILKAIRTVITIKILAVIGSLLAVAALIIRAVWQSILSG